METTKVVKKNATIKAMEAIAIVVGITVNVVLLSYAAYQRGFKYAIYVAIAFVILLIISQELLGKRKGEIHAR